ncbi:hypothetical protein D3C75_343110 [compost metagenome]
MSVDYSKLHTKQLLAKLHNYRAGYADVEEQIDFPKEIDAIKKVLATREHVPNKTEAKRIRQEKARRK